MAKKERGLKFQWVMNICKQTFCNVVSEASSFVGNPVGPIRWNFNLIIFTHKHSFVVHKNYLFLWNPFKRHFFWKKFSILNNIFPIRSLCPASARMWSVWLRELRFLLLTYPLQVFRILFCTMRRIRNILAFWIWIGIRIIKISLSLNGFI